MAFFNPYLTGTYPYMQPPVQPQMSLPTIHADIIQASSIDEIKATNVGAGITQMFILRDDSAIVIKSAQGITVYDRRTDVPRESPYVTRDELERRLCAIGKGGQNESV